MATPTNLFLESLSSRSRLLLINASRFIDLPLRTPLFGPDRRVLHAYFLTSGIASMVTRMADGWAAEVGVIGREGVVAGLQLLGPALFPAESMMQVEGEGLRIDMQVFQRAFDTSPEIRARVLETTQVNSLITMQLAGCHVLHEVEARLARWLLMISDRTGLEVLQFTQEFLAYMMGARRTTVTVIAISMQKKGLIEYSRGRVRIVDRKKLEEAACSCYLVDKTLRCGLYVQEARV